MRSLLQVRLLRMHTGGANFTCAASITLQGTVNAVKAVTAALKQAGIALPARAARAAAPMRAMKAPKAAVAPRPAAVLPPGEQRDCKLEQGGRVACMHR